MRNAFNGNPNGLITSIVGTSRQIQFGLKQCSDAWVVVTLAITATQSVTLLEPAVWRRSWPPSV
jgi:hypothetical protein